ncbi:DUF4440 domain-containing protein [Sphingomonas jatrophae]|uniref:DUF4440 domain-containing protein n=1 Tax=Sphingomonas jatrophae TaxID=1166337 RepID=A0A1I6L336_9SPHN|nr:DUF4440 domain-containing protein [Sphingomonas jatrophae]SFR97847.1 protein of unknown function [Sphingomonas jatrophae]
MNDERIWAFEESLWTADAEHYEESIDDECLMVLPEPPYVFTGEAAIKAVQQTPRWSSVELSERQVARPQEGMIVVAYHARASKQDAQPYEAHCTSTYRRIEHEVWTVVQHQQTPPLTGGAG